MDVFSKNVVKKVILLLGIVIGAYVFLVYIFSYIAPFIVAWLIAAMMEPFVRFIHHKLKLSRGIAAVISVFFVLIFIGLVGTGIIMKIVQQINAFQQDFPIYKARFIDILDSARQYMESIYITLPQDVRLFLQDSTEQMVKILTSAVGPGVGKGSISFVSAVPNGLFFSVVTLIATFFFIKDRKLIHGFIIRQMPARWVKKMVIIRDDLFGALLGYVKTQLILMLFTATICIIGLTIVRYKYALLVGIVISIVDAFPVLGSGSILIPWALYSAFTGNLERAIGLGIIYGVVVIVRQMMEPRVLGKQIGLYPLVTLMSMYIGIRLFGFIGIIIGPIFMIFLKTLQKIGVIHRWK